jgi:thiol-disulfide isomerase/thioredoxin
MKERPMSRTMRGMPVGLPAVALLASLVSGCGSDDATTPTTAMPSAAAIVETEAGAISAGTAKQANTALPDLTVVRVRSGQTARLQTLAEAGKPILLWFWTPHCARCRAEAPALLAFAKQHGARVQILGLGAQDDLVQAVDFLTDTSTQDLEMVWDASGRSWSHYRVTRQPTVVVLDAAGRVTRTLSRHFDAATVLAAAGLKVRAAVKRSG